MNVNNFSGGNTPPPSSANNLNPPPIVRKSRARNIVPACLCRVLNFDAADFSARGDNYIKNKLSGLKREIEENKENGKSKISKSDTVTDRLEQSCKPVFKPFEDDFNKKDGDLIC